MARSHFRISFSLFIGTLITWTLFNGCDEGTLRENIPPNTNIFLEQINLGEQNLLNSVIRLHWSGEDQDGYVIGYEFSLDGTNWSFTTTQDSTFRFIIPPGNDRANIPFYVRAIDNLSLADPSPALLEIPIRNTPPSIRLDTVKTIPDTVAVVFSTLWNVEDLDGNETLDSVFIKVNEGPWYPLLPSQNLLTFVPTLPDQSGPQPVEVYPGASIAPLPFTLEGMRLNANNQLFVKARDIAGAESAIDTSNIFFINPQNSDLLVIDSHGTGDVDDVFSPILNKIYPGYDYFDLISQPPPFWDPTFLLYLQLYDKIFWYSDDALPQEQGLQMYLEAAASTIQKYLNQGGKIFITTKFAASFTDPVTANQTTIQDYSPIDSFSTSSGQARIPTDSLAVSIDELNFPVLKSGSFITGADPFYPKNSENILYNVQLISAGGWIGPNTIAATTRFTNGEINQVFFSIELHKMNGDLDALERLFDQILNNSFSW